MFQTTVIASGNHDSERDRSRCDVVSLNGTGKLLEDGRIVGTGDAFDFWYRKTIFMCALLNRRFGTYAVTSPATPGFFNRPRTGPDERIMSYFKFGGYHNNADADSAAHGRLEFYTIGRIPFFRIRVVRFLVENTRKRLVPTLVYPNQLSA